MRGRRLLILAAVGCAASCGRGSFPDGAGPGLTPTATPTPVPVPTVLFRELFAAGSNGLKAETAPLWADSDGNNAFEIYDQTGANSRGMKATYDDDQNAGTAEVNIPGGLEVNDSGTNVLLTATFTLAVLTSGHQYVGGSLTGWMGNRGTPAGTQKIQVFDLTGPMAISSAFVPTLATGAAPRAWTFNTLDVPFTAANAGHSIQVRFQGAGSSAEGLELADVTLTAIVTQ